MNTINLDDLNQKILDTDMFGLFYLVHQNQMILELVKIYLLICISI